jgi:hypothetical protein
MKGLEMRIPLGLPSFCGKKTLVLGSAPNPRLPKDFAERLVISTNGSAWSAARLGLRSPALTVVDRELVSEDAIREKVSRSEIHRLGLLRGLDLGVLAIVQSNSTEKGDPAILGSVYSDCVWLDRGKRKSILRRVTHSHCFDDDVQGLPSTGVFAVALAAFLGSRDIFASGISLRPAAVSHAYSEEELGQGELRSHTRSDALVLAHISHWTGSLDSLESDIEPLCHNWGRNPPRWARSRPHLWAVHLDRFRGGLRLVVHRN